MSTKDKKVERYQKYYGVGGWLTLFIMYLSVAFGIGVFGVTYSYMARLDWKKELLSATSALEVQAIQSYSKTVPFIFTLLLIMTFLLLLIIGIKSKMTPRIAIFYLLFNIGMSGLGLYRCYDYLRYILELSYRQSAYVILTVGILDFFSFFWILYFMFSIRVKVTYKLKKFKPKSNVAQTV